MNRGGSSSPNQAQLPQRQKPISPSPAMIQTASRGQGTAVASIVWPKGSQSSASWKNPTGSPTPCPAAPAVANKGGQPGEVEDENGRHDAQPLDGSRPDEVLETSQVYAHNQNKTSKL
jgi:hypothetical protein